MNWRLSANLAICGAALLLCSCGGEGTSNISDVSISIDPSECNVVVNAAKSFKATVKNSNIDTVTWSVVESGGGKIDADTGTYTAPNAAGDYHIMAESYANPMKTATAIVHVIPKGAGHGLTNILFIHSDLGANLVKQGGIRTEVTAYNKANTTAFEFWDHGTNAIGLTDASGKALGTNYSIPGDDLTPTGQAALWTSTDAGAIACRDLILASHDVIVVQPPAASSSIATSAALEALKDKYASIRDYADMHADKLFILMPPPPQHRLETTKAKALNARMLSNYIASTAFLSGHTNVKCYNLFDALAESDGTSATANMLKYAFERSHTAANSMPTDDACDGRQSFYRLGADDDEELLIAKPPDISACPYMSHDKGNLGT